jgi:hypothetical protein
MSANKSFFSYKGLIFIFMMIFLVSCAASSAHFRRMVSASQDFETYHLLPDHQYYYSGHPSKPVAIIALEKGYRLDSPHWKAVDPDTRQLRTWMERMTTQTGAEYNTEPNGAYILNNQGARIGSWYSVWELPQLAFKSDKVITVSRPNTIFPHSNRNPGGDDGEIILP